MHKASRVTRRNRKGDHVKEPIRKITLADGTVRYRLVVDIGKDDSGKRKQLTRTFDKQKDARAELSRSGTSRPQEPMSSRPQ